MAKIDRFRSPEEVERLADLKRGVNLVALATERYGLTITEKARDDSAYTLENKAQGERITVKVGPEGYHIYNNHNNDRDKGSVVDFLQQRHPDRNLGQVKGMLQEMVPGAKSALDYEKFAAQQVQKAPSASDARYEALPPAERRAAMVRETMGPNPQLTDASYLLERGLTKETVTDPAFKGRLFTDQHPERQERLGKPQHNVGFPFYNEKGVQSWELRNRAPEGETDTFKMMMKATGDEFGAKNGVWSSNLLQGRGSQPERMIIGESPIDMMSKFQTEKAAAAEKGQDLPNSRYVATGGTPSIEQKAIIQAIIDREQPRQVVLSNDNDAAGQAFNVRYLNDLRPPVAGQTPEQQQEAAAARERITWIAGDNGKKGDEKLLTMTISFKHETAKEGRELVENLRTQAEMRSLPAEEPGTPGTAGLQVRRNAPEVTEVVLRVAPAQAEAVVDLARELRREREQAMPEAARTPENYFVVEKANGKDYNQDILQSRADAQLDAARREAGFTAAPEREIAVVRVLDAEPLPAGVQAPDNRFRSLADEVRIALEATGAQVTATPVVGIDRSPILTTELEFNYTPGSAMHAAAQQVLANAQANGDNRISLVAGIEPAAEAQADSRFHIGLPLAYAPVAVASEEAGPILEARLRAADLTVVPTQVENEPGFVVLLDRSNAREAAAFEQVVTLYERENARPLTMLQSEETAQVRQANVEAYYSYDLGNNATPPTLRAEAIVADDNRLDAAYERLTNVGATLTQLPATEAEREVDAPGAFRVSYPLDRPEVTANISLLLAETTILHEARYDREARELMASNRGETRIELDNLGRTSVNTDIAAEDTQRSADRVAAIEPVSSGEERRARVEDELQASVLETSEPVRTVAPAIAADIDNNGSTSLEEIIRADANHDGVVTGTELDNARFEANQAKEQAVAEQTQQTEADRQRAEVRRRYEQERQQAEAERQLQAAERDTSGPLRSAGIVIFEAEGLPAGTLAAGSATLVTLADKMKEAIEAQGSEVNVNSGRDKTTGQPYSMLSFSYHEGSTEHGQIQQALRDAQKQGETKFFGITAGEEVQRETAPITRTVALNEQPLAIALDAPNPLLESQLRATGATVSNEPVQDRPGLVVVVDTNKGEQLAGVEVTLTKLPAAAVVVEGPEATEMRQQLTLTFREQGGVTPALQAEAILPERIQNDVPERLREAGATVAPVLYAERPESTLSVRYPLDQPEVLGRVSVVLDEVNSRSAQVAAALGQNPDVSTGSVVETPLAQQTRQLVAKEQGLEATGPRALPERQPTEDRIIERPKSVVIEDTPEQQQTADKAAARSISANPEPYAVERRIILDITTEKPGLAPTLEAALIKGGFQVQTAPIEAVGEEKSGTRIEALYRTTDSVAQREQQAGVLRNIAKMDQAGLSLNEPEGQAQERAQALKGPGKPEANQMVAAGQNLRANITVLEVDGEKDRATRLWTDLRDAGAKVGHVAKTELPGEGTKYAFPVEYRPSDNRLPQVSATLEAAARGEGIQVTETDNMRLERLARTSARESKELAALAPEAREAYKRPEPKDYSASRPDAYERVAVSLEELKSPVALKALREELKETGAVVAVQQLDGRPAGSGTVTLSFIADAPKAEAVNDVLRGVAEKGGTVYDLKAGHDRGSEPQVAVEAAARGPLTPEQERQANLAELQTLEARRDALRASQLEATTKTQLAEQYLVPAAAAGAVELTGAKPWVGFGPDLRGEDLRNTDATGMDLRGANLTGQDLRSTDLRGSDLREANLTGVDLRGVNLTGVRLEDAILDGANLEKAFRIVESEGGKRQIEENLTPAGLTGPERDGSSFAPTVALNEQRLASAEMVAAGEENSPAASPRLTQILAPQYSGLSLPTEEEVRAQDKTQPVAQAALETPVAEAAAGTQGQPVTLVADQPERAGLNLPTQQELSFATPPAEAVVELPAVAGASQEPGKGQATAEAVGLEVPAPVAARNTLTPYELLEEAGTAQHVATIHLTQLLGQGPDRLLEIQDRLLAAGAEVERVPGITTAADGKTETLALSVVYAHDDRELPAVHKELNELANVPTNLIYSVRVEDENAAARTATVESRIENTPEAAKALAAELHDGDRNTARLLVQRPALEDVWALEDAGAKVSRIYLPDGPAAMVSYPSNEPGVTSAVSIELDRIERDSGRYPPPHNSNDREVSGPLLGEDPAQQLVRQSMAQAEGLVLEPQPRYELHEMAERDARAKAYFQEEIACPSDPMTGQLANGEPFKGGLTEVLRLEQPDREALEASWKAEKTTLILVVQEAPELRMEEQQPAVWPNRVAEALREAGAEAQVKELGISADTGLEKHLVAISFDNNDPALARIQATLNRLADQDGVQVPAEGYWQREALLGPNGSRMAEPVLAERDRPWLEAVVAITEPTDQERRELTRAGARLEEARFEGNEQPAILVYYDLDNPTTVAKISPVLERAEADNRLAGESYEAGQARGGRVEQYQADIRQEKQQSGEVWEQFSQKYPQPTKVENEAAEPAVAISFAERLRAAVSEQVAELRATWEATTPEKVAIYAAEQRGIADRKTLEQQQAAEAAAAPQREAEKAAYDRGFNGPSPATTPAESEKAQPTPALADVAAAAAQTGGVAAGSNGVAAEVFTDKMLRERRDDERTVPIVIDGPKEGKVLETTEQVKPGIAAVPDQPTGDKAREKGADHVVPPVAPVAPEVLAPLAKAPEKELQHGIIGMEATLNKTAEERMELVRGALAKAGATTEAVVPSTREHKEATLAYSYDPQDKHLPAINEVLQKVTASQPSMIKEEPHSLHYAGIKPNSHEIERRDWPEREGQFAKAHIVVDDADQKGQGRAERIKGDLGNAGAAVGEVKKDGHGHVEMDVSYHTHSPNIERINNTLDKAANSPGIEVRELDADRTARYQGAIDQLQSKGAEKERERGE